MLTIIVGMGPNELRMRVEFLITRVCRYTCLSWKASRSWKQELDAFLDDHIGAFVA
jgi:hypothetical protein